ncbi:MAG: GNAT family N-acetyltransferase [Clostridiales bacterium]|nr:GNAT family N-acetyltransferase [Clostridiales bacterium]
MQNQSDMELITKRLSLRQPTETDADIISHLLRNGYETKEATLKHIRWINNNAYENRLVFNFFISPKQAKECIGRVYIHSKPELNREFEIGYGISEEHRNNGYATEAAEAIIQFAFEIVGLDVLVAIVKPENIPSRRVIEKLGFTYHSVRSVADENGVDCDFGYSRLYHRDWNMMKQAVDQQKAF